MDPGFPELDENANVDTSRNTNIDDTNDESSIDLNAHLSAASTSFWGFVSSATTTLKKTSAAAALVVKDVKETVKKDFNEFQQSLSEESVEIKKEAQQFLESSHVSESSPDSANPSSESQLSSSGSLSLSVSALNSPSPITIATNSTHVQSSSTLASSISSTSPSPPSASSSSSSSSSTSASPESISVSSSSSSTSSINTVTSASSGTWSTKIVDNVERVGDSLLNKAVDLLPASIWTFGGSLDSDETDKQGGTRPYSYSGNSRKEEDRSAAGEFKIGSSNDKNPCPKASASPHPHNAYSPASVKAAKRVQMESNHLSFTTDPTSPNSTSPSAEFLAFSKHFHTDYDSMWKEEVETKLPSAVSSTVNDMYHHLVVAPSNQWNTPRVDAKQFWCRFLFRQRLIEAEEAKRTALLGKIHQQATKSSNQTEDDSWGDEDDNTTLTNSETESATPTTSNPTSLVPAVIEPSASQSQSAKRSPTASESPVVIESNHASSETTAAAPTSAPIAAVAPKVKETPQQMRARLEAEAKERIQQKLAEKKKQLAAQAAAASASASAASTVLPPVASSTSASSSLSVDHSSDQSTFVTPAFSSIIQQSIPTNTTPEPLKRHLQRATSSTRTSPSPSPAPASLPLHPHTHTHAHNVSATPAADLQSASPPLTTLSRSSSTSSNHSNNGWVDLDQEKATTHTAVQPTFAAALATSPPSAGSNAASETKSSESSNADGWDEWE